MRFFIISILFALSFSNVFGTVRATKGEKVTTEGEELTITNIDLKHGFGSGENFDSDISSPKSATFGRDGKKLYINSLEGCKTVVYDVATRKKIKVINHKFDSGQGSLWIKPSGYYHFTHYENGDTRPFEGKPVEAALTPDGRYLFVPYYRRSFDLNAQDPSALAVIDTQKDEIIKMVETGPLPKMVRVSHDGKLLAITHWGDNTVGLLDISSENPDDWHHLPPIVIGKKLNLNYSLTSPVNRDSGSGFLLRGTVFLPGDSLLLVSGMSGPLNVIDVGKREWIGTFPELQGIRHLTLQNDMLFMSRNGAGEVLTVPVTNILNAIAGQRESSRSFKTEGIKRVKVGGGARTLKVSPSGKYIFVACNTASAINIVRAEDMKLIGSISADSFPVGLDISPDGRYIVSTSQGRKGQGGGNAVDFFEINYRDPEPKIETVPQAKINEDTSEEEKSPAEAMADNGIGAIGILCISIGGAVLVGFIVLCVLHARRKKKDRSRD